MLGWEGDVSVVLALHTERLGLVEGQHLGEGHGVEPNRTIMFHGFDPGTALIMNALVQQTTVASL